MVGTGCFSSYPEPDRSFSLTSRAPPRSSHLNRWGRRAAAGLLLDKVALVATFDLCASRLDSELPPPGGPNRSDFAPCGGQNCTLDDTNSRNRRDRAFLNDPTPLPGDQFKS